MQKEESQNTQSELVHIMSAVSQTLIEYSSMWSIFGRHSKEVSNLSPEFRHNQCTEPTIFLLNFVFVLHYDSHSDSKGVLGILEFMVIYKFYVPSE